MVAMKHIVSIGGGVSSTLELPLLIIEKYGAENVDFVIAALKGESSDLWRMVDWLEAKTGKHVTRVAWTPYKNHIYYKVERNYWIDAPPWAWSDIWRIFNIEGMMGNSLADPCSRVLKRTTMKSYILDKYRYSDTVLHVGITKGEIDRQLAIVQNWMKSGVQVEFDLCDVDLKGTSAERAERILGWIPHLYVEGHSHNNCNGFCVKAGHEQMAMLLYYDRPTYLYHEGKELEFQQKHNTAATIMRDRKTRKGVTTTTPLTLRDFRLRMVKRWKHMLPGLNPFTGLDATPGCSHCESVA